MATDQELNEAVAKKLGHIYIPLEKRPAFYGYNPKEGDPYEQPIPDYCHSIVKRPGRLWRSKSIGGYLKIVK